VAQWAGVAPSPVAIVSGAPQVQVPDFWPPEV
jgi:hypothetical protein